MVCLDIVYCWKLKTENWKYCNKIILKCVNSVVGPSFKIDFTKFRTCESQEHYMKPTEMKRKHAMSGLKCYPNSHEIYIYIYIWRRKKKRKILMRIDGQQKRHVSHVGYMYSFSHNGSMQQWKQFIMRERRLLILKLWLKEGCEVMLD